MEQCGTAWRGLPSPHASLAFGVPTSPPGTLYALTVNGGIILAPKEGELVCFGRKRGDVDVCLGEDDQRVSRVHGTLTYLHGQWRVGNIGRTPLRLPASRLLFSHDTPVPLSGGYTPLLLRGSRRHEHVLELYVADSDSAGKAPLHTWKLSNLERAALVVLARRYLAEQPYPQPLTWDQAAEQLSTMQPDEPWTAKRVERLVAKVRARLSQRGVFGLCRDDVDEPIGNSLNHNLILELLDSATLGPADLWLLEVVSS